MRPYLYAGMSLHPWHRVTRHGGPLGPGSPSGAHEGVSRRPEVPSQSRTPMVVPCYMGKLFSYCGITSVSCDSLAALLRSNRYLLHLNLSYNPLGDIGLYWFCDALKQRGNRLQKIDTSGCRITGVACSYLAASLRSNRSLLELNLGHNELGDAGVSLLCDVLKQPDNQLQKIKLVCCYFTHWCCGHLARALKTNLSLTELDLSRNNIGDEGIKEFCEELKDEDSQVQTLRPVFSGRELFERHVLLRLFVYPGIDLF
ncbi:hypothetical protein NDU88_011872 [Pleurodeles waltl]|uniref:Uncharacterized protein n=1 Tax=Pleurodeles waltl TaxID=8319 RepID=A0AAV7S3Z9_PLEWA|nr:hypothetical protein NDU88_011872 [Pleurodeles waltl]